MKIRNRVAIVVLIAAISSFLYGAARHYSPSLVLYVVGQALMQKAPPEIPPAVLHERLHALLAAAPDDSERMKRLLRISERLEKVQKLTPEETNDLLATGKN